MKKNWLRILLALVFAVAGLYLALRGVDFQNVGQALVQARWGWIGLAFLCVLSELLIRSIRWRILLGRKLSIGDGFGLICIGYLVSNVFPLRAGDAARGVAAGIRSGVSPVAALSTVVVERTLDLLTVVLFLLGTLPFVAGLGDSLTTGLIAGALSLGLLITLILMALFPHQVETVARWLLGLIRLRNPERLLKLLRSVLDGLSALRSPKEGLRLAFWSLLLWVLTAGYYVAALRAFVADPPLLTGFVLCWTTALGMATPAPGGVGPVHYAIRVTLTLGFGLSAEIATTYALVAHAAQYLIGIGLGAAFLLAWGISPSKLQIAGPKPQTTESE